MTRSCSVASLRRPSRSAMPPPRWTGIIALVLPVIAAAVAATSIVPVCRSTPARIVLKNVDERIRPGMTANVKIPVASAENVTAVPLAAVFTEKNPETSQMERYVYVQQGETFEKRNVKVGI